MRKIREFFKPKQGDRVSIHGFTLVEITIVLVIIGVLFGAFISLFKLYVIEKRKIVMEERTFNIRRGLADFIEDIPDDLNIAGDPGEDDPNRYPCPAPLKAALGASAFGTELCPDFASLDVDGNGIITTTELAPGTDINNAGVFVIEGAAGQPVLVGAAPTRTLGIGSENAIDIYGNKFVYAVSVNHVVDDNLYTGTSAIPAGLIRVVSQNEIPDLTDETTAFPNTNASYQVFALLSAGPDGAGAYVANSGSFAVNCKDVSATVAGDRLNCAWQDNNLAVFRDRSGDDLVGEDSYDDEIFVDLAVSTGSDEGWWREVIPNGSTPLHIINKNDGFVGIGTEEPISEVHIQTDTIGGVGALTIGADEGASPSVFERTMSLNSLRVDGVPRLAFVNEPTAGNSAVRSSIQSGTDSSDPLNGYLSFSTRDNTMEERMRITAEGDVGVGTIMPRSPLEVSAVVGTGPNTQSAVMRLTRRWNGVVQNNFAGGIRFDLQNDAGNIIDSGSIYSGLIDVTTGSETGFMAFRVNDPSLPTGNDNNEKMRILGNGNVGIGTTQPVANLHVKDDDDFAIIRVTNISNDYKHSALIGEKTNRDTPARANQVMFAVEARSPLNVVPWFPSGTYTNYGGAGIKMRATQNHAAGPGTALEFYHVPNNSTNPTVQRLGMILNQDGRVGIGAIKPNNSLEVRSTTNQQSVGLGDGGIELYRSGVTGAANNTFGGYIDFKSQEDITGNPVDYDFRIFNHRDLGLMFTKEQTGSSAPPQLVISDRAGTFVGVGVSDPQDTFHVVGHVRINGSNGECVLTGNNNCASDLRLKEDIKEHENVLSKFDRIRGVSYVWKDKDKSQNRQYGVIAQEIEAVFPELVSDIDGYKAVNYQGLTSPLIQAVKELRAENKMLRANLDDTNIRLAAIEAKFEPSQGNANVLFWLSIVFLNAVLLIGVTRPRIFSFIKGDHT